MKGIVKLLIRNILRSQEQITVRLWIKKVKITLSTIFKDRGRKMIKNMEKITGQKS
jgi:hypothetical protein